MDSARPIEVVNVRVTAAGLTPKPKLPFVKPRRVAAPKPAARRPGRFDGRAVTMSLYRWDALAPGTRARGPAIVTGGEATVVVPPKFEFRVDGFSNVVITNQ
jgi:N-methylhydantoinase A